MPSLALVADRRRRPGADKPLVGIVSISATEANNARYIKARRGCAEELGWQVSASSTPPATPTRPTPRIQNFAQRGAAAIVDMVFPFSSIGAGLDAAK